MNRNGNVWVLHIDQRCLVLIIVQIPDQTHNKHLMWEAKLH